MPFLEETWLEFAPQSAPEAEADQLAALAEDAQRCVSAGARRIWVCPSEGTCLLTEPLRLALFVALRCEALRVVAAGLQVSHWIRFAEDVATADGLSGGRLEVAFETIPPVAVLESLRQAWSGARVAVASGDPVQIHPRPVGPDGPPLWARVEGETEAGEAAALDLGAIACDAATAAAHSRAAGGRLPLAIPSRIASLVPVGLPLHAIALSRRRVGRPES